MRRPDKHDDNEQHDDEAAHVQHAAEELGAWHAVTYVHPFFSDLTETIECALPFKVCSLIPGSSVSNKDLASRWSWPPLGGCRREMALVVQYIG